MKVWWCLHTEALIPARIHTSLQLAQHANVQRNAAAHQQQVPREIHTVAPLDDGTVALSLLQALIPLGLKAVEEALQQVVAALDAFGLARSSVWRRFIGASARALRPFHERRHDAAQWLVLLLDGTTFASDQIVIALGVTTAGEKLVMGLVHNIGELANNGYGA